MLKRAAAVGIGGGGWVGERGRDWAGAGAGDTPFSEAKNDKEKLTRELQSGAMQPAKRGIGAGG